MSKNEKADAIYAVGDSMHERQRLQDQANLINPFTRRLFENAGITKGMKVLDIGSGAGDVTFLLAELVGPSGSIIGVDSNGAILETARQRASAFGYSNITYIAGDIRTIELSEKFDAVTGRLVLLYLKDPVEALKRVANYVRSGGIIAFMETDLTREAVAVPSIALVDKMNHWVTGTFRKAGMDIHMGLKLRQTFIAAGFGEPHLLSDAVIGGGYSWVGYKYTADLIRSLLPVMETLGVATAFEVDIDTLEERFRNESVENNCTVLMSPWIGAWSRKA